MSETRDEAAARIHRTIAQVALDEVAEHLRSRHNVSPGEIASALVHEMDPLRRLARLHDDKHPRPEEFVEGHRHDLVTAIEEHPIEKPEVQVADDAALILEWYRAALALQRHPRNADPADHPRDRQRSEAAIMALITRGSELARAEEPVVTDSQPLPRRHAHSMASPAFDGVPFGQSLSHKHDGLPRHVHHGPGRKADSYMED